MFIFVRKSRASEEIYDFRQLKVTLLPKGLFKILQGNFSQTRKCVTLPLKPTIRKPHGSEKILDFGQLKVALLP